VSDTTVHRDTVIKVLRAGGVDVSRDGDRFTLAKKDVAIQTYVLPLQVERKMLFRFQHRYQIPIHWFFNPEMIPGSTEGIVQ
jgi:hypothetical protein